MVNRGRLGCTRLAHKQAGAASPHCRAEQPGGPDNIHCGHQNLGEHAIRWWRVGLHLTVPSLQSAQAALTICWQQDACTLLAPLQTVSQGHVKLATEHKQRIGE